MKSFRLINLGILPLLLEAMTPGFAQHDQREQESRRPNQEQEARPERQQQQPNPERQPPEQRPEKPSPQPRPDQPRPQGKPAGQVESPHLQPAAPARQEEQQHARGQQEKRQQQTAKTQQELIQRQPPTKGQQGQQEKLAPQQSKRPVQEVQRDYANQHRGSWIEHRAHNWQAEHRSWQQRGGYTGYRIPDGRYRSQFGSGHRFRMFNFPLLMVGGFPRFQYGGLWFGVMDPWPEYWSDDWYDSDDLYVEFYGGGYYLCNRMHPTDRMALTVFVN